MEFYHLISVLLLLFIFNSTYKTLSVNSLCENNEKIRPTFAEIFGQFWEIDQNSNWQNEQIELNLDDSIGNDQNNEQFNDQQKCEIVHKFHAIKEGIKKKGKYSEKNRNKIEQKIGVKLGICRGKIYKWKKEFGIYFKNYNKKNYYEIKKQEFLERINEFKRTYKYGKLKQFANELGISKKTFRKWKNEFGVKLSNGIHSNGQKMSKMNDYYKMKKANPSLSEKKIAELLKISSTTLKRWKENYCNK